MKKNNTLARIKELANRIESDSRELNELMPLVNDEPDELISVKQAAILLGKAPTTTYELIKNLNIPVVKCPTTKVSKKDIINLITPK